MTLKTIPAAALEFPAVGQNLQGARFGELLGSGPTLLVFLRHLG